MSMPNIPDLTANIDISRSDVLNVIIASVAMEELSIAHILNAEGEKLQYVLGTLEQQEPQEAEEITICDIMAVNKSIQKTLKDVIKAEMLLGFKLENIIEIDESGDATNCKKSIKGHITWRDGDNITGKRPPTVVIQLLRDGVEYRRAVLDSMGSGNYTFDCLPVWKSPGVEYVYRVEEPDVPAGYRKTIEGYNVTNTIISENITISGRKIWNDSHIEEDIRPDNITVLLLQNNKQIDKKQIDTLETDDTLDFSFTGVPQFDNEGKLYVYSVDEEKVDGYSKSIVGNEITNTPTTPLPRPSEPAE